MGLITKNYGHDIHQLYDTVISIGVDWDIHIVEWGKLHRIDKELINLLSDFSQTTRYYNLDALGSSQSNEDLLMYWHRIIFLILEQDVTKRQREKIGEIVAVASKIGESTSIVMQGLDRVPLSITEALALPALHKQVTKFAVFRIINLLSPLRDLISNLSHESYKYSKYRKSPPFPQMQEFLEWINMDRQYILRKTQMTMNPNNYI